MEKIKFKQTEIGMIPEDWEIKLIGELVEINENTVNKKYKEKEIEYIDTSSVIKGQLIEAQKISVDGAPSRAKRIIKSNDILISTVRPNLKHFFFIKQAKVNLVGSTGFAVISAKKVDHKFLYYYVTSDRYTEFLTSIADTHTSTYPSFNPDVIENSFCPYPNYKEQKSIAKIFSDLDEKIEVNRKMNEILEELGQTLFKRWFVDFEFPDEKGKLYRSSGGEMIESELGEIPEGWKVSEIGEELETMLGGTPARAKKGFWTGGTIGWINSGAINDFPIIKPSDMITEEAVKKSATKLMPIKTVVLPFVISLDKEIKISILGFSTCGNQSVIGIIENKKIPAEYIYYWVNYMKKDIYSWATGGAQQHINQKVVVDTPILIPDDQTMNKYKTILRSVFDKIINNAHEILSLEQIRGSLLPKLMTGKIRVMDI